MLIDNGADWTIGGICGVPVSVAITSTEPLQRRQSIVSYLSNLNKTDHPSMALPEYEGPPLDSLDILGIAYKPKSAQNAPALFSPEKPNSDDLIANVNGFNYELGHKDLTSLSISNTNPFAGLQSKFKGAIKYIVEHDLYNFFKDLELGQFQLFGARIAPEKLSTRHQPVLMMINVIRHRHGGKQIHSALLSTPSGDFRFHIPAACFSELEDSKWRADTIQGKESTVTTPPRMDSIGSLLKMSFEAVSAKEIMSVLRKFLYVPKGWDFTLYQIEEKRELEDYLRKAQMKREDVSKFNVGVLYVKDGQTTEKEILANRKRDVSPAYKQFLKLIAKKIRLNGFEGFNGGLDTKQNATGKYSWFAKYGDDFEVMFHVATEIPFDKTDDAQIPRKKYIGNDLATIVFLEGGQFVPPCISGDFLHVFLVVQPIIDPDRKRPMFKVATCSRSGVPHFGPPLMGDCIFDSDEFFRDFLITKVINGVRATMHCPFIKAKMRRYRTLELKELLEHRFSK